MSKTSSSTLLLTLPVIQLFLPTKTFSNHGEASITSLDFDDSGQFLISAGVDKSIQLYDIHKGIHLKDIQSQKYGAHLAKFTHHDKNCLYASAPPAAENSDVDNSIRYLSLADNQYLRYFKGHKESVTCLEVDPVHDTILSASMDRTVKMWDLRSSSATGSIDTGAPLATVAFDPMGIIFAVAKANSASSTCAVDFYDCANCDKKPFLSLKFNMTFPVEKLSKLEFSNNGKLLLVGTNSGEDYIVDAFLGDLLASLSNGRHREDDSMALFLYPSNGLLTFTPCGRYVIAGSSRHVVYVYDVENLRTGINRVLNPVKVIKTDQGIPKIIAFNPKLLTFASADTTVSLWQPLVEQ